jgi:hypothetical protein
MSDILAMLVAQAEGKGCDLITIRALVEEAAEAGARRALAKATPTRSAKTPESGLVRRMVARCRQAFAQIPSPSGDAQ